MLELGVLGEQYILIAARLITASATLLTGLTLAWLIRRIFKDPLFAAFGAAVFLSGDMLLWRGWLAYSDPTFSFFTFGAMACLWVAAEERRPALLALAALGLIGSFLTKIPTGYVYYGVLAAVLIWQHPNRKFLFTPWSISIHLIAVAFPIIWNYAITADSVFPTVWAQVLSTLQESDAHSLIYFIRRVSSYPLRLVWHLMPISAIVLYCLWSRRLSFASLRRNSFLIALLTVAINLLPYWFLLESRTRYIIPIYPLLALCMTYVVLNSGRFVIDLSAKALIATVGVALVCAVAGYPLYEHYFRGSYDRAAQAIMTRAGELPIFATDHSAIALSIVADLNKRRAHKALITVPPAEFITGFVLANEPDASIGAIDTILILGREAGGRRIRYLLCRGDGCHSTGGSTDRRLLL
jgi:4-amino-4-deoxy-L-arabinose transferase-like glycosyltransferase